MCLERPDNWKGPCDAELMRAYLRRGRCRMAPPTVTGINVSGCSPLPSRDQDFQDYQDYQDFAAWLQDRHLKLPPLNACLLLSTKTGQGLYSQHEAASFTVLSFLSDLAALLLLALFFFAVLCVLLSSWLKAL